MADVIKCYKIAWQPKESDNIMPAVDDADWQYITNTIHTLPNFFPEPDTVDISTVDNCNPRSMEGMAGAEPFGFGIYDSPEFETIHDAQVAAQDANEAFWMKVEYTNRQYSLIFQATVAENIPTPEGAFGDLDDVTLNYYVSGDISKVKEITTNNTPTP